MKSSRKSVYPLSMGLIFLLLGVVSSASGREAYDLLAPRVEITCPSLSGQSAKVVAPEFRLGFSGIDPDAPDGRPIRYRFLLKPALDPQGGWIRTPAEYAMHEAWLISWDEGGWSPWTDYPSDGSDVGVPIDGLDDDAFYVIAIQVMDADGAVSVGRSYQVDVAHIQARGSFYQPELQLYEPFLGTAISSLTTSEIASGQPLNFSWIASAEAYCGEIASYRFGWDLLDPDDPDDPGWAVPPGLTPEHLYAPERIFTQGVHTFRVRSVDSLGVARDVVWYLQVIPFVDPQFQLPLLVIDQVVDRNVNSWPDQSGQPRNDEAYRDAYWQFLADSSGGVAGLDWGRDWIGHLDQPPSFSDVVNYEAVLCYAEANSSQPMFQQFRPLNGRDRFVWLHPYQENGGNLFLVGGTSMESFLEILPNYAVPIVFESHETDLFVNGQTFVAGFGTATRPDGSEYERGPRMYPYATAGIAALDWTATPTKYIYGRLQTVRFDRTPACAGLKGLTLDPDFALQHGIIGGALPDSIPTDAVIDWPDLVAVAADTLMLDTHAFPFNRDEFIDFEIGGLRATPIIPQACDGPEYPAVPGGTCVEPMFRGVARFDWVRERRRAGGDPDWPAGEHTPMELEQICGPLALTSFEGAPNGSARTNGQVFGYLSYKTVPDKPSGKADVYWGFDPYRFDHAKTKQAIRWVLDYFGLVVVP